MLLCQPIVNYGNQLLGRYKVVPVQVDLIMMHTNERDELRPVIRSIHTSRRFISVKSFRYNQPSCFNLALLTFKAPATQHETRIDAKSFRYELKSARYISLSLLENISYLMGSWGSVGLRRDRGLILLFRPFFFRWGSPAPFTGPHAISTNSVTVKNRVTVKIARS